jgi:aminopeptidase
MNTPLSPIELEKYADVLFWGLSTARRKKLEPYDNILLRYDPEAEPLAEVLHRKLLQRRFNVIMRHMSTPVIEQDFFKYADQKQRQFVNAGEKYVYEDLQGNIFLHAPSSLTHLKDVDPKKFGEVAVSRKFLRDISQKREEQGVYGWTLCTYPTVELAKQAGLSLKVYKEQICKACFIDEKDPVKKWQEIFQRSIAIKKWLNALPIRTIRLETGSMDLEVSLGEKRRFMGVSGHNIPSFELFTSPDWRGTRGTYYANLPSYKNGNYVEGVKLTFEKGRVVKISASKGEQFVKKMLSMDKGASQLGELSLTDKRFSKIDRFMADTLFDENFGGANGNCHVAVGASYSDTYTGDPKTLTTSLKKQLGYNDSALHWDLINTEEKHVTAILKNGKKIDIYSRGLFLFS